MASRKANLASVHSTAATSSKKDRKERTTRSDQEKLSILKEYDAASRGAGKQGVLAKHETSQVNISNWRRQLGMGPARPGMVTGASSKKLISVLSDGQQYATQIEQSAALMVTMPQLMGPLPSDMAELVKAAVFVFNNGPKLAEFLDANTDVQRAFAKVTARLALKRQGQVPASRFG